LFWVLVAAAERTVKVKSLDRDWRPGPEAEP